MTFLAKPKVAHPSLPKNALGFTRRDYEGAMSTLCAGCGHDSISSQIITACYELGIKPETVIKLSGIGCSSKSPAYFMNRVIWVQRAARAYAVRRHGRYCSPTTRW